MRKSHDAVYDALLVVRWRRGDGAALDELLRRWERRLLYYVRRLVSDEQDALDVLQQTWMQVVRKLATVRDPTRLAAWLYHTARNTALAHRRSARAAEWRVDPEADVAALPDADTSATTLAFDDIEAVHEALAELTPAHREVLTLLFLQDLSVEEIAEVIDASPGTVKSRAFYARQHLRAILDRKGVRRA